MKKFLITFLMVLGFFLIKAVHPADANTCWVRLLFWLLLLFCGILLLVGWVIVKFTWDAGAPEPPKNKETA